MDMKGWSLFFCLKLSFCFAQNLSNHWVMLAESPYISPHPLLIPMANQYLDVGFRSQVARTLFPAPRKSIEMNLVFLFFSSSPSYSLKKKIGHFFFLNTIFGINCLNTNGHFFDPTPFFGAEKPPSNSPRPAATRHSPQGVFRKGSELTEAWQQGF